MVPETSFVNLDSVFSGIYRIFADLSVERVHDAIVFGVNWLRPYSLTVSLLFLMGIVYCFMRIEQIASATRHHDHHPEGEGTHASEVPTKTETAKRWERILSHAHSDKEGDWRLAILEADILLSEMVTGMGYHGDSLGEKLKGAEKSDFTSIDKAWEAHAVRNKVAHEGSAFALTEREASRVITLYEEVFREFHYI